MTDISKLTLDLDEALEVINRQTKVFESELQRLKDRVSKLEMPNSDIKELVVNPTLKSIGTTYKTIGQINSD